MGEFAVEETEAPKAVITEIDRLQVENNELQLLMRAERRKALILELQMLDEQIRSLELKQQQFVASLGARYGFDPGTTRMEPGTGRIIPLPMPPL